MSKYDEVFITGRTPDLHEKIRIAVANIPVDQAQVEHSILGSPNRSRARLKRLNQLLNDFVRCGSKSGLGLDLVVFPEVCIPYAWAPMLVSWAREHQIGLIAGLEHRVDRHEIAINEILSVFPYRSLFNRKSCMLFRRRKRIYSPEEVFILENNHLGIPEKNPSRYPKLNYHLFRWRGASFSVYNCYELASIEDRSIFKGKVDFIVVSEFNRDVNYFSNIIESASRDLHCYIIQANDSKHGDSRVVCPSKTENMNPLRIKGGDNLTFLTMELNLKALRDHQRRSYGLQKDSKYFKPTPPGLHLKDVRERIKLGVVNKK